MPIATTTRAGWAQVTYTDSHTRACRRLGSQEVAQEAVAFREIVASDFRAPAPTGWKRLGEGATRVALQGPDGWVYKIGLWGYDEVNAVEEKFWSMGLAHKAYRPAVPHHRLFKTTLKGKTIPVLAMEPLKVDSLRTRSDKNNPGLALIHEMAAHIGCTDLHAGNIGWRGEHPVLLDAGNGVNARVAPYEGCDTCKPKFNGFKGV